MTDLSWVMYSSGYLVVAILFLWITGKLIDWLTPYSLHYHLTERDNPAAGIFLAGLILGVAAIICGLFYGDTAEEPTFEIFLGEIIEVAIYGIAGLVLLLLAGLVNDKLLLRKFSNRHEIIENHNSAVAVVVAATYVGSGFIIAGGISGSVDLLSLAIAAIVGQLLLVVFSAGYQLATSYDDQDELGKKQNVAAALAYAGNMIAFCLILMKGLSMGTDVEEWTPLDKLWNISYYAIAGGVLLLLTCLINDWLFFPKVRVREEIVKDQNNNAGLLEGALAVAMGAALVMCL